MKHYYKTDERGSLDESCPFNPTVRVGSGACVKGCGKCSSYSDKECWIECTHPKFKPRTRNELSCTAKMSITFE